MFDVVLTGKGVSRCDWKMKRFWRGQVSHPGIRERLDGMALAVADEDGDIGDADATGFRLIEEMRQASALSAVERKAERETAGQSRYV
ncbi:MAG: hypothetical protein LBF93_07035 [Zoogloeaceae bacterium]|jgi:hypothetical protein|nr:hypothetical protein [Zoogloeaceae bacterium]